MKTSLEVLSRGMNANATLIANPFTIIFKCPLKFIHGSAYRKQRAD
jgi:hypothetical protein